MRRHLSLIIAGALLVGACGLAACGDDDDSGNNDTTTTVDSGNDESTNDSGSSDDSGDDSGDASGNAEVQEYCDRVTEFADAVRAASGDVSQLAELQDEGTALAQAAADLSSSDLDAEDAEAVGDCSQEASEALQDLVPG